jgi:hypothetical protein
LLEQRRIRRNVGIELKTLFHLLSVFLAASAHAAPTEWLEGTVLEDCEYCKTDAFQAERRRIANQAGVMQDAASGMGYVVTTEGDGPFVWGRAALVGTGNLIRTDAHVLFSDTGRLKTPDGKIYFEPMHHGGVRNLIEIDLSSIQRGGAVGPLETDVKNDWAIARLREDAIDKFDGHGVFAFLWDLRITHDDIVRRGYTNASALVLSRERALGLEQSCPSVTDDHPSHYAFGVEEVLFIQCPSEYLQAGSSGSALAILSADDTWNLGGQIVGRGLNEWARDAASGVTGPSRPLGRQLVLGNVPMLRQVLTIVYLQELLRRGIDPRER